MKPLLTLGLLVCCAISGRGADLPIAPAPREKSLLKCEVRLTGKFETTIRGERYVWDAPDSAEITITNISGADVDIGSRSGPLKHLDLRVKDPAGADVKTEPWSSRLSTQSLLKPIPYILKSGEMYVCGVCLLRPVPEVKLVAGTYKVRAVYTIGNKDYVSNEIEVKWPGEDKLPPLRRVGERR